MTTCASGPSLDICPDQAALAPQIRALLPRGRAWGTHDGGPQPGSVLAGFCDVLAADRAFVEQRICDLRREFFCATQTETNDLWLDEYGLPDGCEPYPDLCTKVAATGGSTCDYLATIAIQAGWSVTCIDPEQCGDRSGCDAYAGLAMAGGGRIEATIILEVDLANSPAFGGVLDPPSQAGVMLAGDRAACEPDISKLECLMARIAPAHARIQFLFGDAGYGELDLSIPGNPLFLLLM